MFAAALCLLIIFTLLFVFLRALQRKSIFFPVKNVEITPEYFGLSFEEAHPETADNLRLNSWFIPSQVTPLTLLFFHGNGGNISHRLHKVSQLHNLGVSVFLIDYRGYGRSQGRPSVAGLYKDTKAALAFLIRKKKIKPQQIVLYGESLGTALAVSLAAGNNLGGLILEGAFSCGRDMAKIVFPYLPACFIPNIFRSLKDITKVKQPKLFIHSKADEIVPIRLAKKLYQRAPEPKDFLELVGGHNTAYIDSSDKYLKAIKAFLSNI